jgi:1,4-dihydroxy-2-naphthoate octaprenyltransferase
LDAPGRLCQVGARVDAPITCDLSSLEQHGARDDSGKEGMKLHLFRSLLRVLRIPFFTATLVPIALGAVVAYRDGAFHAGYLAWTLCGALCVQAGLHLSNDYFDHLSGVDALNQEPTPFSGGSRAIQEGALSPSQVLRMSLVFYLLGAAVGLCLGLARGWPVLALGATGLAVAIAHNIPMVGLYFLAPGLGEVATGIGFGPLIVLGTYYVQAQRWSGEALLVSAIAGALIAAVLYINEFPDLAADQAVGKKTMVVALGRKRAVRGYVALIVCAYILVLAGILAHRLPYTSALVFLSLPLALRAMRGALRFYDDIPNLLPTNAATIQLHLAVGILLILAYLCERLSV